MSIVLVKFQSKKNPDDFSGKEYSYIAGIPLNVGDIVKVPTANGFGIGKVVEIDVPSNKIGCPLDKLKRIQHLANLDEENPQNLGKREKGMQPLTITDTADEISA
ncbi:MAG: hypothetical protein FWC70_10785 [Defluviitaleaceae bacterium]|nr:hypothetical protein [Defluviitaleaceae bacterium]